MASRSFSGVGKGLDADRRQVTHVKHPHRLVVLSKTGVKCGSFLSLSLFLCSLCLGQDAAPVNLDFSPQKETTRQNNRDVATAAEQHGAYDLRVRYVKVEGRWVGNLPLPLAAGDRLTREKLSATMAALRDAIMSSSNTSYGLHSKGEVGVLYIDVKYDTTPSDRTVGVIFRPFYIDISLVQVGNNVLPIPRSPWPTFYQNVPEPLLALNPTVGFSYDRVFGSAISASLGGNLVPLFSKDKTFETTHELDLIAEGTKSLEESFYRADGGLTYTVHHSSSFLQELNFSGRFDGLKEPLGNSEHTRNAGAANLGLKLKLAPNTHLTINAGYRRTSDDFLDGDTSLETNTTANEQTARLLLDTIPPSINGFLRAAFWEESGWETGSGNAYQRFVGRAGYEKEVAVAPNQTIGIEIVAGGGRASGNIPSYASFFGGNAPGQFLYDSPNATTLMNMPSGPIIRSLGENEARLRGANGTTFGGDSFWHVNLNVTLPIPAWSMPLIPNELTDIPDANGNPISIKELLRRQIDVTGPSMLAAVLQGQGLSAAEAARRAKQILQEVTPATHFIIDDANLYSIKPLIMVDAAGMSGQGGSSETWLAAGAGVQLTVVTAKFEFGYMRTLSGPTFGQQGNAFVRLVFQNLF
jgi:hypothetical protein